MVRPLSFVPGLFWAGFQGISCIRSRRTVKEGTTVDARYFPASPTDITSKYCSNYNDVALPVGTGIQSIKLFSLKNP
jgi:hypothetical protein